MKRIPFEIWKQRAEKRNHILVSVTEPNAISRGMLNLQCKPCGCTFSIQGKSYTDKSKCPKCQPKKTNFKKILALPSNGLPGNSFGFCQSATGLKRVELKTPRSVKLFIAGRLKELNPQKKIGFIRNCPYLRFIDQCKERPLKGDFQMHHIIPKHMGGSDDAWNLIALTGDEHIKAHQLLFDCFENILDKTAASMLAGLEEEGRALMSQRNQEKMKAEKKGFYDPELQRELSLRPHNKRKNYIRNEFIRAALDRGFRLQHNQSGFILEIKSGEFNNLDAFMNKLMDLPMMSNKRETWLQCKEKQKFSGKCHLIRLLTGHRDRSTQKCLYSFMGWRILGIFTGH